MHCHCFDCGEDVVLEPGEEFCPECGAYLTERDPYEEDYFIEDDRIDE